MRGVVDKSVNYMIQQVSAVEKNTAERGVQKLSIQDMVHTGLRFQERDCWSITCEQRVQPANVSLGRPEELEREWRVQVKKGEVDFTSSGPRCCCGAFDGIWEGKEDYYKQNNCLI